MDPNACYQEMNEAVQSGDLSTARMRAEDLKHWIDRGGFCPTGTTVDELMTTIAGILRITSA